MQGVQDKHWLKDWAGRRTPDHPVVYAMFARFADIVASTVENAAESSVLDVGCGNGFLQWALEKRFGKVAGLDYSQQMLDINPCKEKYRGSCTNLSFYDSSYDVVVASHLLHHLVESDRIQALSEMRRVARYTVVSFEPNGLNPFMFVYALVKREEYMALSFSVNYMRKLCAEAGLTSVHIHVQGWITPNKAPVWWLPVGRILEMTPLRRLGFDICSVAKIDRR